MVRSRKTISPFPARMASSPSTPLVAMVTSTSHPSGNALTTCLRAMAESSQINNGMDMLLLTSCAHANTCLVEYRPNFADTTPDHSTSLSPSVSPVFQHLQTDAECAKKPAHSRAFEGNILNGNRLLRRQRNLADLGLPDLWSRVVSRDP